jgi:Flp pilus assembly protein TadG
VRRRTASLRRTEHGSAVADFALCSVVLIPVFFAVLQLALVWHVRTTLVSAASEGARYGAAFDRQPADGARETTDTIRREFGDRLGATVAARQVASQGQPVVEVTVTAHVPVLALWGPAVTMHVSGHAVKEVLP